jgi:hypothetical protein
MAREDALHVISSEFKLWGVKFQKRDLGSGHIELRWQVTPDKEVRRHVVPKTGSDHRGPLNSRAQVRRLFQQDGLVLKEILAQPRKKPALQRALEVPEPVETDADQVRLMRGEIADLTDAVFRLTRVVAQMKQIVMPTPVAPVVQESPPVEVKPVEVKKPAPRRIKAIEHLSESWNTTDALARSMGISKEFAYRKLYYLVKIDAAELCGGSWRKKPPSLRLVAAE